MWKKIKQYITYVWVGFFMGMKKADSIIQEGDGDIRDEEKLQQGRNVFSDLLEEKETHEVEVTRDEYYRVNEESRKYHVDIVSGFNNDDEVEDENTEIHAVAKKKDNSFYEKPNIPLLESKNYRIYMVQEQMHTVKGTEASFRDFNSNTDILDKESETFNYTYSYTPLYNLERYTKRVVLKTTPKGKKQMDIYFSKYQRHFMKIDSLFIAELHRVLNGDIKSELVHFDTISFITDKAFGVENIHSYVIKNTGFKGIEEFDGNFVLKFNIEILTDTNLTDKFKLDEVTENYKQRKPRQKTTTFYFGNNLNGIKIDKNENSN